jgi:ABC-type uncharacterized transport system ATPase subunit
MAQSHVKLVMVLENVGYVEEMAKSITCRQVANGVLLVKAQVDAIPAEAQVITYVQDVEVQGL